MGIEIAETVDSVERETSSKNNWKFSLVVALVFWTL